MTRALIIEDEPKAARVLATLIRTYLPDVQDLATALSGTEALAMMDDFQPQLVFLDIEMPGMGGFELLEALAERSFELIFTTAFDHYAIRAIRFAALDYLLKPIDPDELREAYQRYLERRQQVGPPQQHYRHLLNNLQSGDERAFKLSIATTEGTHFLHPQEIVRCEADRNYTHFFTADGRRVLASKPLAEYEPILAERQFLRVHRSHLVNIDHIRRSGEGRLWMSDETAVPIARRKRAEVALVLERLSK